MERDCSKERWEADKDHEDEALSLSDLPLNKLMNEDNPNFKYENPTAINTPEDDEFDFGCLGGFKYSTTQPPPQMCSADEVFFQGRILPARLSVSSDNSSAGFHRRGSASESITKETLRKFRSINSSRSSSSRSHYSSSSINNSITTASAAVSASAARNSRPIVPNLFHSHSHPSPKPQIKASPTAFRRASTSGGRSQKSSTWDFFRPGLVKTPGMELQDLKHRSSTNKINSVSRNDGAGSNGSKEKEITRLRARISIERKSAGILRGVGCKCSVETVAPKIVIRSGDHGSDISAFAMREMKMKKVQKEKEQQEKLALSRHRTFEWLKELSHASFPCEA